jgi:hypothetical protein
MAGSSIYKYRVAFADRDYRSHSLSGIGGQGSEWWMTRVRDYRSAVDHLTSIYGTGYPLDHTGVIRRDTGETPAWCFQPDRQNDSHGYTIYLLDDSVLEQFESWQTLHVLKNA